MHGAPSQRQVAAHCPLSLRACADASEHCNSSRPAAAVYSCVAPAVDGAAPPPGGMWTDPQRAVITLHDEYWQCRGQSRVAGPVPYQDSGGLQSVSLSVEPLSPEAVVGYLCAFQLT